MAAEYEPEVPTILHSTDQRALEDIRKEAEREAQERLNELAEVKAHRQDERLFRRNQRNTNYALIGLTAIAGFTALWQSHLTQEAITTANRQAGISEYANELTRQNMMLTAKQTQQAMAENHRQNEQSERQSRIALNESIATTQLDQRAWINFKNMELNNFEIGKDPSLKLTFENTGKTLALEADGIMFITDEEFDDLRKTYNAIGISPKAATVKTRHNMIAPGEIIPAELSRGTIGKDEMELITAGKEPVYFAGEIKYSDIFNRKHVTQFCFVYDFHLNDVITCQRFNTAN